VPASLARVGHRRHGGGQRAQLLVSEQGSALFGAEVSQETGDGRILHGDGLLGVLWSAQHLYRSTKGPSPFLTDFSQTLGDM
jgi:hypothetical protein